MARRDETQSERVGENNSERLDTNTRKPSYFLKATDKEIATFFSVLDALPCGEKEEFFVSFCISQGR